MSDEIHPVQTSRAFGGGVVSSLVMQHAYDVYRHLYPGQTLERLNERGGFGASELIALA